MGNTLKFEFDFDEVFDGIKQGVIRELTETNYEDAKNQAINQIKAETKTKIGLTYSDEYKLMNDIKEEIKEKVFASLIDKADEKYFDLFDSYIKSQLTENPDRLKKMQADIRNKVSDELYCDLYQSIKDDTNEKLQEVISKFVGTIVGNNVQIKDSDEVITMEEYKALQHRDEILSALEIGGVDNWEWYGESLSQYFGEDEE